MKITRNEPLQPRTNYFKASVFSTMVLLCVFPSFSYTQNKTFVQEDVWSVFRKDSKQEERDSLAAEPAAIFKPYLSIAPYVGYNPAYGGLIGIGSTIGMYFGEPANTPISSSVVGASITTLGQILLTLRTNLITDSSKYILRGDWRYLIFSQSTYGLGSGVPLSNSGMGFNDGGQTSDINANEQPILYDYLRLYESFYFRLKGKLYAGVGYDLDFYRNIVDTKLDLDTVPELITHHYQYCEDHGFDTARYTISGIELGLMYDSRDNTIRPTRGILANIAFRSNFEFLGSSRGSLMLNTEFRTYIGLSKTRPDHLVGFWYIGQFTNVGKVPYLGLPAIGWDMYNRSGRGYIQGCIRGVDFVYGEAEYRFPISRYTGILGGVLFVNITTSSDDTGDRKLFEFYDPAAGCGLRIMFNRRTLSNLTIDFGIGRDGMKGVYFNLNEAF